MAIVFAQTVRVYVEQGIRVEAGVNTAELPTVRHVPATAGLSVGAGESAAGAADSVTVSGSAPLTIVWAGTAASRVGERFGRCRGARRTR